MKRFMKIFGILFAALFSLTIGLVGIASAQSPATQATLGNSNAAATSVGGCTVAFKSSAGYEGTTYGAIMVLHIDTDTAGGVIDDRLHYSSDMQPTATDPTGRIQDFSVVNMDAGLSQIKFKTANGQSTYTLVLKKTNDGCVVVKDDNNKGRVYSSVGLMSPDIEPAPLP